MGRLLLMVAMAAAGGLFAWWWRPGARQVRLARKTLAEVDKGGVTIEPFDLRAVPLACRPAADEFVAQGFAVMGAIVTRHRRQADSYSILLLDANASTYARATALASGSSAAVGLSSYLRDGRKLDTSATAMAIADPLVISQLRPGASVADLVVDHRRRLLELQAKDNPPRPIDPEELPDLVRRSWQADAAAIRVHGVTRRSNDGDPSVAPGWPRA